MNPRVTSFFITLFTLTALGTTGVLRGQVAAPTHHLTVFFTADGNGEVSPCGCPEEDYGGATRRAAFYDTLRTRGWDFLTLDAGDLVPFEGLNSQGRLKAETLARAMALMDYSAITLGDHDLAPGPEFVSQLVGWLGKPIVATNYELPQGQSDRSRVVKVQNWNVGVVAFLDPDLVSETAAWLDVEPWQDQKSLMEEVDRNSDVLVAMAHIADTTRAVALTELYPQIDFLVTAHEGKFAGPLAYYNNTYVAGGPGRGRYLGRAEVGFTEDGTLRQAATAYLPVIERWGRRSYVDELIFKYKDDMRELVLSDSYQEEMMASLQEPHVEFIGNAGCVSCHGDQSKQWGASSHARARETLVKEGTDHDPDCQKCHTTGFGYRTGFATAEATPEMWNVGCESCHGAGALHVADPEKPYGTLVEDACITCHDSENSPNFDYETYLPQVRHDFTGGTTGAGKPGN